MSSSSASSCSSSRMVLVKLYRFTIVFILFKFVFRWFVGFINAGVLVELDSCVVVVVGSNQSSLSYPGFSCSMYDHSIGDNAVSVSIEMSMRAI